jgi:hypothetical protein
MFNICCFPKATVVMQTASMLCCLSYFSSKCVWVSNLLFYTTAWLILFGCFRRGLLRILAVFKSKTQAAEVSSRDFFFFGIQQRIIFTKYAWFLNTYCCTKFQKPTLRIVSCKKFCTTFMLVLFMLRNFQRQKLCVL